MTATGSRPWTANPQPIWDAEFFAPINIPRALRNQTLRQIAAVSIDGNRVRVVLSNECGELVDIRINDMTLWCECAECHVVNIEDSLSDLDDDEV
jgi:hypothetical protein